jgi:hypothetical protein
MGKCPKCLDIGTIIPTGLPKGFYIFAGPTLPRNDDGSVRIICPICDGKKDDSMSSVSWSDS